ncbi:MAG: hypothetical protein GY782_07035, partial [Gammaproteobacteria bacterium]|nr:hypothetical protein [Gammaproteobacteria bacterium]
MSFKQKHPETLIDAINSLTPKERDQLDREWYEIFSLSNEKGHRAILDAVLATECPEKLRDGTRDNATYHSIVATLLKMKNWTHKAMHIYLFHIKYWPLALTLHQVDTMSYWKKQQNVGHNKAMTSEGACAALAKEIGDYLYTHDARHEDCDIKYIQRGKFDCFLVYASGYSQ